jgi:PKD repeat protein
MKTKTTQVLLMLLSLFSIDLLTAQCNASFTTSGCVSGAKQFQSTSTGTVAGTNYNWSFGNGSTATTPSASISYTANGTYTVCLTITHSVSGCSSTFCDTISVNCTTVIACQAAFTSSGCVNGTKQFQSTSTGTVSGTNYSWSFGNGSSAITPSASITYTSNSTYNVCLTITNSLSGCSSISCNTVLINCTTVTPCQAAFISSGCINGTKQFQSTSTGTTSGTNYNWNFGNSSIATTPSASATYTANGTYTVCLTITNSVSGCSSTICDTAFVICVSSTATPCQAAFTSSGCVNGTKQFQSISTGTTSGTSYNWSFGNGTSATTPSASTTYTANGNYLVCLTITNSLTGCSSSSCNMVFVNCTTVNPCQAAFISSGCVNGIIQFQSTSTGTVASTNYNWSFGNGSSAVTPTASATYTANGTYTVCLTINDSISGCFSTRCDTISVNCISSTITPCQAAFTSSGCVNGTKQFQSTSTGTISGTNYNWIFGNGSSAITPSASITYTSNGTYNVCLTITNSLSGCSSISCNTVLINCITVTSCQAAFTSSGCVNGTKQFQSTSTGTVSGTNYTWNFGNGSTATITNASSTYTANGNYTVCLTITNSVTNCSSSACNTITINCVPATSVKEVIVGNMNLTIFPNPNNGIFDLEINEYGVKSTFITISIINTLGEEVFTVVSASENASLKEKIKLDDLANGAYFVKVITPKSMKTSKIIINR